MREKSLIYFCGISIIIGTGLLYVLLPFVELSEKTVMLEGRVEEVFSTKGITIAQIKPYSSLPVIFYDEIDILEGENVVVYGTLKEFQGRIELVVKG